MPRSTKSVYDSKGRRKPRWRKRRQNPRKILPLAGFPKQKLVKLRYVQELEIVTPTSGLSNSVPFVANGAYDPYYPIGGHQPKGFDQWMAVYSHFNVLGSKIYGNVLSFNSLGAAVRATPQAKLSLPVPTIFT